MLLSQEFWPAFHFLIMLYGGCRIKEIRFLLVHCKSGSESFWQGTHTYKLFGLPLFSPCFIRQSIELEPPNSSSSSFSPLQQSLSLYAVTVFFLLFSEKQNRQKIGDLLLKLSLLQRHLLRVLRARPLTFFLLKTLRSSWMLVALSHSWLNTRYSIPRLLLRGP